MTRYEKEEVRERRREGREEGEDGPFSTCGGGSQGSGENVRQEKES